jgi:ABC-type uncharacterized transport system involved in gliding motility auxiliary subunit
MAAMAGLTIKGRTRASSLAGIVLVGAILVLVNVIFAGVVLRLDLTGGKEFTVSKATKDVLRELKDLTTVTVYMTRDLPPQLATLRREISDLLDEYRTYGHGKVQVEFVNPTQDPQTEQRMRTLGIPQIMAQTVEKDQLQVKNIYLGIVVSYLDRQEVIPVVQDTYTLEYDLTSAILKVGRQEQYVIGVLSGPTEHDLSKHMQGLRELLQKQFQVQPINLRDGESAVPPEVNLLIVAGPNRVPERVQYQIDQYVMRGGRVIVLIDPIRLPEDGTLQGVPVESGLEALLAHYGVRVQKSMVVDRALCAQASFSGGYIRYTIPYPYWPKAVPDLLNRKDPITNRLESLVLPWVAPLEVDVPIAAGDPIDKVREMMKADRKAREEMAQRMGATLPPEESTPDAGTPAGAADATGAAVTGSVLVRTSPRAGTVSGRYDLNPQQNFPPSPTASQVLAVSLNGRFTSFWADRPAPAAPGDTTGLSATTAEPKLTESPETRILVVGNAQFATDTFLGQFPENSIFLQNAIDAMTLGDRLISIRSRGATDRPLKPTSDAAKSSLKLIGILGAPLLVIAFGLVRSTLRRRAWSAQEVAAREA